MSYSTSGANLSQCFQSTSIACYYTRKQHHILTPQLKSKKNVVYKKLKSTSQESTTTPIKYLELDSEFTITKISFGSILAPIGVGLLVYGFGSYFELLPGSGISSILLIYGFPLMLLGFALKYAELEPVACKTTQEALDLRPTQMTDNQKQIREDVTRFRYGDEQHLDEALDRIFKLGRGGGLPRRLCPKLIGVREETRNSMYTLILEFESDPEMTEDKWVERKDKFKTFFGPGINCEIIVTDKGADVELISDGSGEGITGKEKKDVLPPLLPGLAPRKQD